jgi:hypothetical protein
VLSNRPVRPVNGANQVPCLVLLALGARLLPQGFELNDPFEVLILVEDAAAGRLYTMRAGEEIRHWRLSRLLPEYCNRRIRTTLLRELLEAAKRPVDAPGDLDKLFFARSLLILVCRGTLDVFLTAGLT